DKQYCFIFCKLSQTQYLETICIPQSVYRSHMQDCISFVRFNKISSRILAYVKLFNTLDSFAQCLVALKQIEQHRRPLVIICRVEIQSFKPIGPVFSNILVTIDGIVSITNSVHYGEKGKIVIGAGRVNGKLQTEATVR